MMSTYPTWERKNPRFLLHQFIASLFPFVSSSSMAYLAKLGFCGLVGSAKGLEDLTLFDIGFIVLGEIRFRFQSKGPPALRMEDSKPSPSLDNGGQGTLQGCCFSVLSDIKLWGNIQGWRSKKKLMTPWAIVCDGWCLEPQNLKPRDTPIQFSERVRDIISVWEGLKKVIWDGFLKYSRPRPNHRERK
ncbi:hypothetical protein Vadar_012739 [Vaccinium darrowii]|uniref:Uncharacterized protein n=1 Tax=Vaccinium darrowii TaxID=229202 RepID=A0ACB7X9Q7_9ERIC|nr:hypothetical protein Vadar_012739 [Vaccinium darrowii]